jgi:TRAP-type transport system periplasmic protein
MPLRFPRRQAMSAGAAFIASFGLTKRPARSAEFSYKYGHTFGVNSPVNVRAVQMANDVKRETNGRLEIQIFPNSMLGGDPAMIQQVREGALQFSTQSGAVLAGLAPAAGIIAVPYAFKSSKAGLAAQNGELGAAIRKEIELKAGFHVFPTFMVGGYRQITSSTHPIRNVDDLTGFKLRSSPGPLFVDVYKTLGAQVVTTSIGEAYAALQTHLVDGQENPYNQIEDQHFYEVQKYLSVMDAIWSGTHFYCNNDAWKALPANIQAVVERNVLIYGGRTSHDNVALDNVLADKLQRQGLTFNQTDPASFKARLSSWYTKNKQFYGPTMWGLLEKYGEKLG